MSYPRKRGRKAAVAVAVALTFAVPAIAGPIAIEAHPVALYPGRPNEHRAGKLIYRGGLELRSDDDGFGGWSDLAVSGDGTRILAISDEAHWLKARLTYDGQGNLSGITGGEIAPMLDEHGAAMIEKEGDAEGLAAITPGEPWGRVLVSFERNVRVWRYDLSRGLDGARPTSVPIGYWVAALDYNKQLEAITVVKPDTLMAIAEVDPAGGDIPGAFEAYPGAAGHLNTRLFTLAYNKPFAVTSVANAPEGGVYILERRFSFLGGFGAEIRYVSAAELHPGARITGTVIANLGGDSNIDNMEGIAARRGPDGKTLLYVMSDDNYNALESTVLMMFEVAG